jgi:hypothetical protein
MIQVSSSRHERFPFLSQENPGELEEILNQITFVVCFVTVVKPVGVTVKYTTIGCICVWCNVVWYNVVWYVVFWYVCGNFVWLRPQFFPPPAVFLESFLSYTTPFFFLTF